VQPDPDLLAVLERGPQRRPRRVLALTPPRLTTNLRTERPVHPTAAPASPAETPDAINSITNNLSSRVIRANFERPSDTSDRATTT
jgi:hypothetical protein